MTTPAIIMMLIALFTVWGGLIAASIHVVRHAKDYK